MNRLVPETGKVSYVDVENARLTINKILVERYIHNKSLLNDLEYSVVELAENILKDILAEDRFNVTSDPLLLVLDDNDG